jgi:hypothetical protein
MMHTATILKLKNVGKASCRIEAHPHVSMTDASGKAVVPEVRGPKNPSGDRPLTILPGAQVQTEIRWLHSNGSADNAHCVHATRVWLNGASTALDATVCGYDAPGAKFDLIAYPYGQRQI